VVVVVVGGRGTSWVTVRVTVVVEPHAETSAAPPSRHVSSRRLDIAA
jgi:hypothetical protein